jgi:hypothetical protein
MSHRNYFTEDKINLIFPIVCLIALYIVSHDKKKTINDELDTGSILDMGQPGVYKDRYQLSKNSHRAIEKKQNLNSNRVYNVVKRYSEEHTWQHGSVVKVRLGHIL